MQVFNTVFLTGIELYGLSPLTMLQAIHRPEAAVQLKRKRKQEADKAAEAKEAAAEQNAQEHGRRYSGVENEKEAQEVIGYNPIWRVVLSGYQGGGEAGG
ncbi:hypothetical protein VYU27_006415 [Nannochloropsis oceanica]